MTHVISLNTGRSYPLELIQLDQLLVNILQTYEQRIKLEHRSLEVNFCSRIDTFYQYRPPLERILTNLLDNALKFSNYGSRIDIIISENANKDSINIAIKDEGIGIMHELQSRIFERTFRVEDSRNTKTGGSGLGLYIASELAQQIDASISVESELNVGTTMMLTLKSLTFRKITKESIKTNFVLILFPLINMFFITILLLTSLGFRLNLRTFPTISTQFIIVISIFILWCFNFIMCLFLTRFIINRFKISRLYNIFRSMFNFIVYTTDIFTYHANRYKLYPLIGGSQQ